MLFRAVPLLLATLLLAAAATGVSAADTFPTERDVTYGKAGDVELKLDFARPEGDGPFPTVICIHGGGWRAGRKEDGLGVIRTISAGGYVTASINYRLTPEAAWPAQIHDCKAAIRFLRTSAVIVSPPCWRDAPQ